MNTPAGEAQLNAESEGSATEYLQKQLGDQYEASEGAAGAVAKELRWRRLIAYGFKLFATLGGIAVAAGLPRGIAQVVGIAIAVAIALDRVFANHLRLLAVAAAAKAYSQLLHRVKQRHQVELSSVLELKRKDPNRAEEALNRLNRELLQELHQRTGDIQDKLADEDIAALRRLSVEEKGRRGRG